MSNLNVKIIVEELAELLIASNKTLVAAESCTGGWIAKQLTDLSGSSAWFDRGFVTYSNLAKQEMLGVAEETIDIFAAVSEETVVAMAKGALQNSHADFSLSVSGIAGPSGGSVDKPVGLVWFAWCKKSSAIKDDIVLSKHQIFRGDRNAVREQSVIYSLKMLIRFIKSENT